MIVQYEALYNFIIHILSGTKIFVGSNIFLIWNQYLFELKYTMIWSLRYIFDVWQSEHACEVLTLHQHVLRIFDFEWFRTRSNATIKGIHLFTFQKGMNWYYYRIFQHNYPPSRAHRDWLMFPESLFGVEGALFLEKGSIIWGQYTENYGFDTPFWARGVSELENMINVRSIFKSMKVWCNMW